MLRVAPWVKFWALVQTTSIPVYEGQFLVTTSLAAVVFCHQLGVCPVADGAAPCCIDVHVYPAHCQKPQQTDCYENHRYEKWILI